MAPQLQIPHRAMVAAETAFLAVTHNAELQAKLTCVMLIALGYSVGKGGDNPARLPAALLLELGAIAQLRLWELEGVHERLATKLPTFAQALADLESRLSAAPGWFDLTETPPLVRQVGRVWLEELGWEAREILQADVVVGQVDEEALVEPLAQLLWANRDRFKKSSPSLEA